MTADHPTREERYAKAEADAHLCAFLTEHGAVVALPHVLGILLDLKRALVAADPAPAQPDAALSGGEALAIVKRACDIECRSPGKHTGCSSHEPYRVLRDALLRNTLAARAAQPEDPCICPPDLCLGAEHQDGPGTVECRACLALDPELPCLHDPEVPAQPDAALSDDEREALWEAVVREFVHGHHHKPADGLGIYDRSRCDRIVAPVVERILAARAAQPVPARLPNACKCGDCYHPAFGPNTDGDPCPWCRDCGCAESDHSAQPVPAPERKDMAWDNLPAPEASRGVAEVKAEALREAARDWRQTGPFDVPAWLDARADRIVRDALPADDGADCCRERTTAGGCGCGS